MLAVRFVGVGFASVKEAVMMQDFNKLPRI